MGVLVGTLNALPDGLPSPMLGMAPCLACKPCSKRLAAAARRAVRSLPTMGLISGAASAGLASPAAATGSGGVGTAFVASLAANGGVCTAFVGTDSPIFGIVPRGVREIVGMLP